MPRSFKPTRKYRNKPTGGYASAREAKRAGELKLLERAGEITFLREQVKYELIPKQNGERACHFIADFAYLTKQDGEIQDEIVEDCKGFRTEVYKIKRKLMLFIHGIKVLES